MYKNQGHHMMCVFIEIDIVIEISHSEKPCKNRVFASLRQPVCERCAPNSTCVIYVTRKCLFHNEGTPAARCVWMCGSPSGQWFILLSASERGLSFSDTFAINFFLQCVNVASSMFFGEPLYSASNPKCCHIGTV